MFSLCCVFRRRLQTCSHCAVSSGGGYRRVLTGLCLQTEATYVFSLGCVFRRRLQTCSHWAVSSGGGYIRVLTGLCLQAEAADVFSLGCVFYYVLSDGHHPFDRSEAQGDFSLEDNIMRGRYWWVCVTDTGRDMLICIFHNIQILIFCDTLHARNCFGTVIKFSFVYCMNGRKINNKVHKLKHHMLRSRI